MFGVLSVLHTSIYLRRKGGLMADLTVIILTKNEELNIAQCIESVKSIAKRIVVVDSFSTDNTVDIARRMGADVYQHEFINHSKQFKWALENTNIRTKWVLRIDADERLAPETAIEIEEKTKAHENDNVNGFLIKRRNYFLGRFIRHGGMYPLKFLRLFKHGKADVEDRNMDEHIILLEGSYLELENDLLHFDFKDLHSWIAKHNEYARKEVQDYFEKREESIGYLDTKTRMKRILKYKLYYKMPLFVRPFLYFCYRYFIRLGFLDGKEGLIFHFLQAFWYRFLVDAMIYERRKNEGKI